MKKFLAIVALLLVLLCAAYFMRKWYEEQKVPTPDEVGDKYDRFIYDALSKVTDEDEFHTAELTTENAVDAIKQIKTSEKYYAVFNVERFSDDATLKTKNTVWVSGKKYRAETTGDVKKTFISDGERLKIINANGDYNVVDAQSDFSYFDQTGVADIEYFVGNAENELITARFAKMSGRGKDNIIYVEFYDPRFNQTERFYISADYGVVLAAETYIDDKLAYRLTADEFSADYSTDDTIFDVME